MKHDESMEKNNSYWHALPAGPNPPEHLYVIIETPRGSKNKFEISKKFPGVVLDRVLHSSVMYPIEYGAVAQTLYADGDPLDAMVLTSEPTYPGIVIEARPVGVMKMMDQGDKDNKILMVAEGDPRFKHIKTYKDLPEHTLKEIANFFQTYKILENKKTEVLGWEDGDFAIKEIKESMEAYKKQFP